MVAALPDLPVGEPGEQAAVGSGQGVGHRRQRLREPAAEHRPRLAGAAPVDARLRITPAVRGKGAGARRDVPEVRVVRVDGDRPRVVAVAAVVGGLPGLARVFAERRAAAAGLVCPPGNTRVPRERVHVGLRARTVVGPRGPAVGRAHQTAQLDSDEDQVAVMRARRDPAHVRRPRSRWEAPGRLRR